MLPSKRGVRKGAAFVFRWLVALDIVVTATVLATSNNPPKPNTAVVCSPPWGVHDVADVAFEPHRGHVIRSGVSDVARANPLVAAAAIMEAGERGLADVLSFEFEPAPHALSSVPTFLDTLLFRAGPGVSGVSGVEVDVAQIRVRMGSFKLDIPRSSVRSAHRSRVPVGGTVGVHGSRGRWLVNGSADGLAEIMIEPPCHLSPGIDNLFGIGGSTVDSLTVSLDDPDGFIAALEGDGRNSP